MIYPKLEEYLDAVVLLYLTDEFMRTTIDENGLNFERLPQCNSTKIGVKAQKIGNFKLAQHECRDDLCLLERVVSSFTQVPTDGLTVIEKLNVLMKQNRIFNIGQTAILDPEQGYIQIKEFRDEVCGEIVDGYKHDLMSVFLPIISAEIEENKDCITIGGFEKLSGAIGGFNPGRMGILMAETGFGKTNLGLSLALRANATMGVGYVNMEMSFKDICKRMGVLERGITYTEFHQKVRDEEWRRSFRETEHPMCITDGKSAKPIEIKAWIRKKVREDRIQFVIVDYDQCLTLNTSYDTPEWKAMQDVLMDFDDFCKEVNIFLLVIAQINREGEIAASHRALYKAHSVMLFCNDDEFGPSIVIKKNRHGRKGAVITVQYDQENSKITEQELVFKREFKKSKVDTIRKPEAMMPAIQRPPLRSYRNYAPGSDD